MTTLGASTNMDDTNVNSANTGLMAFWADIDTDYVLRYQQWHNCEHIPERVSIPGFLEGRRYRSVSNEPHFLMFYETRDSSTLASDAYMAALNAPTPWTREALTHFRNPVRGIYSRIGIADSQGQGQGRLQSPDRRHFTAPYITTLRFDLPDAVAASESEYAENWLQAACQASRVTRIRMYRVDTAVGNIVTSERKIYSGGPGKQAYLLLIEHAVPPSPPLPSETDGIVGDAIRYGDAALVASPHVRRANEERSVYWLEIAYQAKEIA